MEPLSIIAGAVTTVVLPKVLEKASEEIGKKIGEKAVENSDETIQKLTGLVQAKLEKVGMTGLLQRARENPTERNIHLLQSELVDQMGGDTEFSTQLQQMIGQIRTQSPSLQIVLDTVRIKGDTEIGDIEQVNEGSSAEQIVGRNLGVGGNLKMGNITQKIQKD